MSAEALEERRDQAKPEGDGATPDQKVNNLVEVWKTQSAHWVARVEALETKVRPWGDVGRIQKLELQVSKLTDKVAQLDDCLRAAGIYVGPKP